MFGVFDRYILKNLIIAAFFTAIVLVTIIVLAQSLRFLELIVNSGAPASSFWTLNMLALPRFLEIILPITGVASIIFVYHRMMIDSEISVVRAAGFSPLKLARPALTLAVLLSVILWAITLWLGPLSLNQLQLMRHMIKTQYSSLLLREGVFNAFGNGLMVYIHERGQNGELKGLLIHDSRDKGEVPSTIMAQRGAIVTQPEAQKVIVYDGARQQYLKDRDTLQTLNFDRYTLDLPESDTLEQRWREPDERTLSELLFPDPDNARDQDNLREFAIEIHRRISTPLLALAFAALATASLLLEPVDRRGHIRKIVIAVGMVVVFQSLYLTGFSIARHSDIGFLLMYGCIVLPLFSGLFLMSSYGEALRHRWLYRQGANA